MILEAIELGYLLGDFAYHRWIESDDPPPNPDQNITVPTAQEGMCIPIIYGHVMVKAPIITWVGHATFITGAAAPLPSNAPYIYGVDMQFVVGIFPEGGYASFDNLWSGAYKFAKLPFPTASSATVWISELNQSNDSGYTGGLIEVMPGDPAQNPVAGNFNLVARQVASGISSSEIPGWRGVLSIFLFGVSTEPWYIGSQPNPGNYSIECHAYPADPGFGTVGQDANPSAVIQDLLIGWLGKLGLDSSNLDAASFHACAVTLGIEGHGFSMSWEDSGTAKDRINQVLTQVDGVVREDPVTGLISMKLIRPDFDPTTCPEITPDNCVEIQNFAAGGYSGLPNDLYVSFTDVANGFTKGSGRAQNQANASGLNGEVSPVSLDYPGITYQELADVVAERELGARSRPLMKCRAIVNRSFLRVMTGDVVKLTWPEANIAGVIFRVALVNRGTLENGTIALDLIQDYFYTHRNHPPGAGGIGGLGGGILHF